MVSTERVYCHAGKWHHDEFDGSNHAAALRRHGSRRKRWPQRSDFLAAMLAYERSHWQQAFHTLADLADRGHVEAARIAGQMQRFGLPLYGMQFPVRPTQLAQGAGCSGRG